MTVLILSNERDLTTDFVVRELSARKTDFVRLNTNRLLQNQVALDPVTGDMAVSLEGRLVNLRQITAAYFRRPEAPDLTGLQDDDARAYALAEWNALLKAIYIFIGPRWFSHPKDILLAEDKASQLRLATELGFNVPETLITNDLERAQRFVEAGETIAKPLRQALLKVNNEERVIFTSRVTNLSEEDRAALQSSPVIFQREITKKYDLRVTVVGGKAFAVAIHSQDEDDTRIDWRRGSNVNLVHELVELPKPLKDACIQFITRQNIRFGAIDLILDVEGVYWFLECNPNGQWAWIEHRTSAPIAAAIVDELTLIATAP